MPYYWRFGPYPWVISGAAMQMDANNQQNLDHIMPVFAHK